jgi:hypothetical protein
MALEIVDVINSAELDTPLKGATSRNITSESLDDEIASSVARKLDDGTLDDDVGNVTTRLKLVPSIIDGLTEATQVKNIVIITQAGYDAIATPDPETIYFITE